MDKVGANSEKVLEIWYTFALEKPKPKLSIPQDEWISCIRALWDNTSKENSYVAGFFNGDVKLFDKNHKELLVATKMHQEQINDMIFVKS